MRVERGIRRFGRVRRGARPLVAVVLAALLTACGATVTRVDESPTPTALPGLGTTSAPPTSASPVRPSTTTIGAPTTTRVGPPSNPAPPPTTAPGPVPTPRPPGGVADVLAQLGTLAVKGRAPKTGYVRDQFGPAWTDDVEVAGGHNGCDTRNDILRRDLTHLTFKPRTRDCVVRTGTLVDPYTGRLIAFQRGVGTSNAVQIDHVVALLDAWQKGAQQLSAEQRRTLANDPIELLAVDGPTNASKGSGDAATWLPPNKAFRCRYVALQVAVKARYHLWVTQAERDAITRVLGACTDAQVRGGH